MIGKKISIIFIIYIISSIPVSFGKVLLSSNQKNILPGDILSVQIIIEGETDAEIDKIENLELFNIESQGTSSSFKFINGQSSREKTINYELSLLDTTKKEIFLGPVTIDINGKKEQSNYLVFNVGQSQNSPDKNANNKIPAPDNYYFLDVQVEKDNLFVNQKTLLTLKFYNSVEFAEANLVTPESKDFWLEQNGNQQNAREVINGKAYKVTTIKYFFTPLKEGVLNLDGFAINGLAILPDEGNAQRAQRQRQRLGFGFDSFFEDSFFQNRGKRRRVNLTAPSVTLNVKKLPSDKTDSAFDGVVGQFNVRELDHPNEISSKDSINFSFIVSGDGNLNLLEFETNGSDFKVYKDKDENVVLPGGELQEARRLSYLLIPQKNGQVKIPEFKAKYFDPHDKLFKELIVGGSSIDVKGNLIIKKDQNIPPQSENIISKSNSEEGEKNTPAVEVYNIAGRKFYYPIVNLINKNLNIILNLSLVFSFFILFFYFFRNINWKNLLSFKSKDNIKNLISNLSGTSLEAHCLDNILKQVLKSDFNPIREKNFQILKLIGVKTKDIEQFEQLYQICENVQFSKDKNYKKFTQNDVNLISEVIGQYLLKKGEK